MGVLLYSLLVAFKVEPETFGLGFLLIFKFYFIDFIAAWVFFLITIFFFQLHIQVLSILILWQILWMG